jgi:hypothetical protein
MEIKTKTKTKKKNKKWIKQGTSFLILGNDFCNIIGKDKDCNLFVLVL